MDFERFELLKKKRWKMGSCLKTRDCHNRFLKIYIFEITHDKS